ncbi:uncharacterized protein [Apostichopus japonicus]|uniref:uncharacterized protein isoform X3 n=1 Tax=Stichopus japonicus TaxID=307972 RepID=UPI003AB82C88
MEISHKYLQSVIAIAIITVSLGILREDPCQLLDADACDVCSCKYQVTNCSSISLKALPSNIPNDTRILRMENNKIECIPKHYLSALTGLYVLTVTYNLLSSGEVLISQCENLEEAYMQYNRISYIPVNFASNCSKLLKLDLEGNLFDRIQKNTLSFIPSLRELRLGYSTNLRVIEDFTLSCENMVRIAVTNSYELVGIPSSLLRGCKKLNDARFVSNRLTYINDEMFSAQTVMSKINLRSNPLFHLEERLFRHLKEVSYLVLSNISISSIPANIFNSTSIAKSLDLSNNKLTTIPETLFSSRNTQHFILSLSLSDNQLEAIPPKLFHNLPHLSHLYLDSNKLVELPEGMLSLTSVEFLYIFHNKITSLTNSLYLEDHPLNGTTVIAAEHNPTGRLSVEFLQGIKANGQITLSCDGIHIPMMPYNINVTCVHATFQTKITVLWSHQIRSLEQRGFYCIPNRDVFNTYTCEACAQGSYDDDATGTDSCIPCPIGGFYQDDVGQFQRTPNIIPCKKCNNGTFVANGGGTGALDCQVCPEGTNKSTHAGYRACFCLENYFRRDRFGGCELCPQAGLRCSNDFVTIEPGFYWNWTFANITEYRLFVDNLHTYEYSYNENTTSYSGSFPYVHPCRQPFKCDNKNDTIEGNCHRGYRGFMCTECVDRYFSLLNFCHECPQIWVFALEVVFVLVLCACLLGYLIYTYNRQRLEEERSIVYVALARGKIVLGFYQVMGEFWDSLDVIYWPEVFKGISNWLALLQFNISTILIKPSCFFPKVTLNAYSEFLIGVTVTSVVVLVPAIAICFRKIRATYIQRQFSNIGSGHPPPIIFKQDRLWLATLLTLYITYPSTCYSIITLYSPACQSFALDSDMRHNVTLLRSDFSINCNTRTHRNFEIAAYFFSVYIVAFPGVLFYLLRKHQKLQSSAVGDQTSLTSSLYPQWLRFLCENYKDQYWYWEIVELTRKVSQMYILILFGWGSSLSIFITVLLAVIFLTLHASFSPMRDKFEQNLQLASLSAIFLNMLMVTVPGYETDSAFAKNAMSLILIFLNISVLCITFGRPLLHLANAIYTAKKGRRGCPRTIEEGSDSGIELILSTHLIKFYLIMQTTKNAENNILFCLHHIVDIALFINI